MAKRILHGLYNGKIIPWERREPRSEAYREAVGRLESEEAYFLQKLSPEDRERFQNLTKLYMDLSFMEEDNTFSYGFTLGLLLTLDVMKEAELICTE